MPELPEVETIKSNLQMLIGWKIQDQQVLLFNLRNHIIAEKFNVLKGQTIKSVSRRAKYLLFKLSNSFTLVIHLGMTGQLRLEPAETESKKHDAFKIFFTDQKSLVFNDKRKFGLLDILDETALSSVNYLKSLGTEPLEETFTVSTLTQILKKSRTNLKSFLINQKNVAGIGNIYASEILFEAKLSPLRLTNSLIEPDIHVLYESIRSILKAAISKNGSFLSDYYNLFNEPGDFTQYHKAYGRESKPCFECALPMQRIKQVGLSTYCCANCQV